MSQQHYFTDLKLDRIFMILRRGGLVIIKDERGRASLVRAAEFADFTPETLTGLVLDTEILCLTARHMQAFGKAVHADLPCYSLPAATLSMAQTHALILGDGSALPDEANWLGERANSLPDIACRLLRAARLIPAALLTRISINDSAHLHHMADW